MKQHYLLKATALQIFRHLESSLVILFALTVSVMAILHTARQMLYSDGFLVRAAEYKRTYRLQIWNREEESSKELVDTLLFGDDYPVASLDCINVYADGWSIVPNVYGGNARCSPEFEVLSGRMFTEEELENGENVIILADFEASRLGASAGGRVALGGDAYEVVGICDGLFCYIPYETAMAMDNVTLDINTVEFTHTLSGEEKERFYAYIESLGGSPQTLFDFYLGGFLNSGLTYLVLILLVAFCALSIVAQLFLYMAESRREEMEVYETLGISRRYKLLVFYVPILLFTVVSAAAGDVLYYLLEPIQEKLGFDVQFGIAGFLMVDLFVAVAMAAVCTPIFKRMEKNRV